MSTDHNPSTINPNHDPRGLVGLASCPHCGKEGNKISSSTARYRLNAIERTRTCNHCARTWQTREYYLHQVPQAFVVLKDAETALREFIKKMEGMV